VRRLATSLTLACAVAGAAGAIAEPLGDFGRPRDSVFADEFLPWLKGEVDWLAGVPVTAAPYTDDEKDLRKTAYAVLIPIEAYEPSFLTVAGVDFVELWRTWVLAPPPYEVRSYCEYLVALPVRSHTARYARLIDDIRADIGRVPLFFSLANRVLEADAIRARSFLFARVSGEKFELARLRIAENRGFIDRVYDRFRERIASYHYALQCLLVLTPSPNAVEAERALFVLEDRLKRMTVPLPAAVAAGGVISK
jgi:hypothetical protein